MAKTAHLDEEDRKLHSETKLKLDEATKLMGTLEVLSDPEMMKAIKKGKADIKAGRVTELRTILKEEAR